jgi:antibiotic biosynthesis monooxygenase (ABM) superfamily enzyme
MSRIRLLGVLFVALCVFAAGYAAGQNKFETPGTVLHVVVVKFKADAAEADRQKAIEGVREMARQIPGIRRVWLKSERVQPREFSAAFAIEFENRAAADAYAEHPARQQWFEKVYNPLREASNSIQVTN